MEASAECNRELRSFTFRVGMAIAALFWALQFGEFTALSFIANPWNPGAYVVPRIVVFAIGLLVTACMIAALNRSLHRPLAPRLALTAALILAASLVHALSNFALFRLLLPGQLAPFNPTEYLNQLFTWIWFFTSIAGAVLAIAYAFEVRERERRLGHLRAIAQEAQLRALRYQLNPHFLFNTLNSIAALIARGENRTAEDMVENLSDFLRTGLELDPHDDIPLSREMELQSLYLGIETLRFPERLRVSVALPEDLRTALVPSLITQPLVENAIKYAVARSSAPVSVEIAAARCEDQLEISVSDTGPASQAPAAAGTGVGLANVAGRLRARFGAAQALLAGPNRQGGYTAAIRLPLRYAR
jgi:signal transduction histidine kinase